MKSKEIEEKLQRGSNSLKEQIMNLDNVINKFKSDALICNNNEIKYDNDDIFKFSFKNNYNNYNQNEIEENENALSGKFNSNENYRNSNASYKSFSDDKAQIEEEQDDYEYDHYNYKYNYSECDYSDMNKTNQFECKGNMKNSTNSNNTNSKFKESIRKYINDCDSDDDKKMIDLGIKDVKYKKNLRKVEKEMLYLNQLAKKQNVPLITPTIDNDEENNISVNSFERKRTKSNVLKEEKEEDETFKFKEVNKNNNKRKNNTMKNYHNDKPNKGHCKQLVNTMNINSSFKKSKSSQKFTVIKPSQIQCNKDSKSYITEINSLKLLISKLRSENEKLRNILRSKKAQNEKYSQLTEQIIKYYEETKNKNIKK